MKSRFPFLRSWMLHTALCAFVSTTYAATQKLTPEKESARLGKLLKPISDQEWEKIAHAKFLEKYSISQGDTLFGISKKLFGDPKFWPKIWAINNETITNPHWLKPGFQIAFALTSNSRNDAALGLTSDGQISHGLSNRSLEWKELTNQNWEYGNEKPLFPIDDLGFDLTPRPAVIQNSGFDVSTFAVSDEITGIGKVLGSSSPAKYLSGGDLLYLENTGTAEQLKKDQIYAIINEHHSLISKRSDRPAYAYSIIGHVKILSIKDPTAIGRLMTSQDAIPRGSLLIPMPPRVPGLNPIPGPRPLSGTLLLNPSRAGSMAAQHQFAYVDRGSEDGVQPGMVFRAYGHIDPSTGTRVIHNNVTIEGDLLVTQVTPSLCTVRIFHSHSPLTHDAPVVLLTNLSDLDQNDGFSETGPLAEDDLDQLDHGGGLNSSEKRELKQLEKWNENPNNTIPPSNTPAPVSPAVENELDTPVTPPAEIAPSAVPNPVAPAADNLPPPMDLPDPTAVSGDASGAPPPIAPDTAASPDNAVTTPSDAGLPPLPDH